MTTAIKIDKKWDTKKVQETTSNVIAGMMVSAFQALGKAGQEAHEEFHKLMTQQKLNHYKKLNIKTPLDLAHAIGEQDHNLFGSEIEVTGDEKKATVTWNSCGVWEACEKLHKFTPEQQEKMGQQCMSSWKTIADDFGFKFEPSTNKEVHAVSFSK
jgi:hypothetical protein